MIQPIKETSVKTRRKFDQTFKREALNNWLASGKSAAVIAQELGLNANRLYAWKQSFAPAAAGAIFKRYVRMVDWLRPADLAASFTDLPWPMNSTSTLSSSDRPFKKQSQSIFLPAMVSRSSWSLEMMSWRSKISAPDSLSAITRLSESSLEFPINCVAGPYALAVELPLERRPERRSIVRSDDSTQV